MLIGLYIIVLYVSQFFPWLPSFEANVNFLQKNILLADFSKEGTESTLHALAVMLQ